MKTATGFRARSLLVLLATLAMLCGLQPGHAQTRQPVEVTGEVFGPDGVPVAGASIWAAYSSLHGPYQSATASSDARGTFTLRLSECDPTKAVLLIAQASGVADALAVLPGGGSALLQLAEHGNAAHGKVLDAEGKPVAGAVAAPRLSNWAWPDWLSLPEIPSYPLQTRTDAGGCYALSGLPPDRAMAVVVQAEGYVPTWVSSFRRAQGDMAPAVLQREACLSGRVMYRGRPIGGARVSSLSGRETAITDSKGRYELRGLYAGKHSLQVRPEGGILVARRTAAVTLAAGDKITMPDIQLVAGGTIRGCVTLKDGGGPAAGVSVGVSSKDWSSDRLETAADGSYTVLVPPGLATVRIANAKIAERQVDIAEGQTVAGVDFEVTRSTMEPWGRRALPHELSMKMTPLPGNDVISAYEPVVVRVDTTNVSKETVVVPDAGDLTTRIQVRDPKGRLAGVTARPDMPMDLLFGTHRLEPGQTHTRTLVISALCPFSEPGEYTIKVQQLGLSALFPGLVEASTSVRVEPFDAARLQARCEQLFSHATKTSKTLYSVRHDIVLPYLEKMASMWQPQYSCRSMRRIGTEAANAMLAKLCAREDEVGRVARSSAELPLPCSMWDIEAN